MITAVGTDCGHERCALDNSLSIGEAGSVKNNIHDTVNMPFDITSGGEQTGGGKRKTVGEKKAGGKKSAATNSKVHTGPRGGKYVVRGGKKVYLYSSS